MTVKKFPFQREFPRGRELSRAEIAEAELTFNDVFDRLVTDETAQPWPDPCPPNCIQKTAIKVEDTYTGEQVRFLFKGYTLSLKNGVGLLKEISITPIDSEGFGRGQSFYSLFQNGVVRRFDVPDSKGLPILPRIDSGVVKNRRLAEEMGMNDQPVDAAEVEGIIKLRKEFDGLPKVQS